MGYSIIGAQVGIGGGYGGGGHPIGSTVLSGTVVLSEDGEVTPGEVLQSTDSRLPTEDENDALIGTVNVPNALNPFVTKDDFETVDAGAF